MLVQVTSYQFLEKDYEELHIHFIVGDVDYCLWGGEEGSKERGCSG